MALCDKVKILNGKVECTDKQCVFYKLDGCWTNYEKIAYDNTFTNTKDESPLSEIVELHVIIVNENS